MEKSTIVEKGEVVELRGGDAMIRFKRSSACGHCTACGMLKDMSEMIIDVPNSQNAAVGDRVLIEFTTATALGSSAIAYVFPLIMLFIGVALGYLIGKGNADNEQIYAAIGGLLMVAVSFLIIKLLNPVLKRKLENKFRMLGIADAEEKTNE